MTAMTSELLLTERVDTPARQKKQGKSWLWLVFDLTVFAALVLFFG